MRAPRSKLRAFAVISLLFTGTVIAAAPASATPQAPIVTNVSVKVTSAKGSVLPCVQQIKAQAPKSWSPNAVAKAVATLCDFKLSHVETTRPATMHPLSTGPGSFCTKADDGIPTIANVRISWCFSVYAGVPGYAQPTSLKCAQSATGFSIDLHGPCQWYGQNPAYGNGDQAFGATENFTSNAKVFGVGFSADHYLNIATHWDGTSCLSNDEDTAGKCWTPQH
ncbi:hypothetical protein ACWC2T_21970 [Streptomyces sp. NPDC001393]